MLLSGDHLGLLDFTEKRYVRLQSQARTELTVFLLPSSEWEDVGL
jgi:hypothetical protein